MASEVYDSLTVKELRTGHYTAAVATESTGYIIVTDDSGTQRKLMIQA